jgi:hypothetical protein
MLSCWSGRRGGRRPSHEGSADVHDVRFQRVQPRGGRGVPGQRRQGRGPVRGRPDGAADDDRGQERPAADLPLVYTTDGDRVVIIASKGGAPTHPDWYHNLVANPEVTVEIGEETYPARASVVQGAERDRIFAGWSR